MAKESKKILLECSSNSNCSFKLEVDTKTSLEILHLLQSQGCPSCKSSLSITSSEIRDNYDSEEINFDFLPKPVKDITGKKLIFSDILIDDEDVKTKPFHGFVTRIAPLILATQIIANTESKLQPSDLIVKFEEKSIKYRKELIKSEENYSIGRGSKLSDGFPDDNEGSKKRYSRTYIGADSKGKNLNTGGLIQQLNLIEVKDEEEPDKSFIQLTVASKKLIGVELHNTPEIETNTSQLFGTEFTWPVWYSRNDRDRIMKLIREQAEKEFHQMVYLLHFLDAHVDGVTKDMLIDRAIEKELNLSNSDKLYYLPRSDVPIIKQLKDEGLDTDEISDQNGILWKKIDTTMAGTLSRLKELGFIFSFRKHRQTKYKVTPEGKKFYQNHSEYI